MGSRSKGKNARNHGENPKTNMQMPGFTGGAFGTPDTRRHAARYRQWQETGDRNRKIEKAWKHR